MSQRDDRPETAPRGPSQTEGGPQAARDDETTGLPTIASRRRHLAKLALMAAGAGVTAGAAWKVGKAILTPGCDSGAGPVDAVASWLQGERDPDPPPRLMGEMVAPLPEALVPPPDEDPHEMPRLRGDIAMPAHPSEPTPERPPPRDQPRIKGKIASPRPPQPVKESMPRLRGRIAAPAPPRMPGGLMPPAIDPAQPTPGGQPAPPPPTGAPAPLAPGSIIELEPAPAATPAPPSPPPQGEISEVEAGLRSVYLSGVTRGGDPFTACVRVDPDDEASYEAVVKRRREILSILSPLAEDATLARDGKAWRLVKGLVPGATIRQAGVLR